MAKSQLQWGKLFLIGAIVCAIMYSCATQTAREGASTTGSIAQHQDDAAPESALQSESEAGPRFRVEQDKEAGTISVFREDGTEPLVVQNARPDHRPFLHPIMAPDGNGSLTQFSPEHHKHQTGLYWGFTRVNGEHLPADTLAKWEKEIGKWWFYMPNNPANVVRKKGRDFFHNPGADYWQLVSATVKEAEGSEVTWQTVYNMLDADGSTILVETQDWSMKESAGKLLLDLAWSGNAQKDVMIGEMDYGGMFLRMPWSEGIEGEAVNAARQRNQEAEGSHAMWVDVGMQIEGRDDYGHIAIFDHDKNSGFPQTWRVDNQLGIGPSRAIMGDWQIKKGQTEVIKHRLVAYTGKFNDQEMTDLWNDYVGRGNKYDTAWLWGIAQREGYEAEFLTPEMAVDAMTLKEGFKVNAWAAEPMLTQPMAFCWDDRGRMWVAENRDYESRGSGFSAFGDSKILILEDTDGDGTADSRKVFAEGIPFPAAIAVGFDGLFLGAPPNLLFIPDRDQNDVGDMDDIEVRLTGWGIKDRHETINSLHWGPDGWLYGLEGFATPSKIRKPNGDARLYQHNDEFPPILEGMKKNIVGPYWEDDDWKTQEGVEFNGGVFRYHPVKEVFEVVAHGFSNPWGIDYDAKGQLFISACVIPHAFHVLPGGYFHRQGGQHFNPYVYSDIQTIVDHRHRSAHGGARVYQSDAFPPEYNGRLFMANIHEHAVLSDILEPKGSGFVAHHGDDFLKANNAQWIGFSMEVGPEGGVYVLDWHDADICGNRVNQKETGRIFRVVPENSLAGSWEGRYSDLKKMSDLQLAELQTSKSNWHARRARVILHHRATDGTIDAGALAKLNEIYKNHKNADYRLRAMWARHVTGTSSEGDLLGALADADPHIRAWAVQFLCEDKSPSDNALAEFVKMAKSDPSPVVRMYLAAALQRMDHDARWDIAANLMQHREDIEDHNIPKMIWFGIEPLVPENPQRALELANNTVMPLLSENIARRAMDGNQMEVLVDFLGRAGASRVYMLEGMNSGLEGRSDLSEPDNWKAVYVELRKDESIAALATLVAQQLGDAEAAGEQMATLKDQSADLEQRRAALKGLAARQLPDLKHLLPSLFDQPDLRIEAIRAIAAYDGWDLGVAIMDRYESYSAAEKQEVVQAMAQRNQTGRMLMWALQKGNLPKSDIPAYVARQLRRVIGSGFVEVWGPIDDLGEDKEAAMAKYTALLTDEALSAANPANGRQIFANTCGACHKMYGEGGTVGPDITGSNRSNLDYLLSNILDPSGDIQDDYKLVVMTTRDGRTYAGNVVGENDRQVRLRVVGSEEDIPINKSTIQTRETTEFSMMPEGLLTGLSDEQILDLVAFLSTTEQVEM